MANKTTQNDGAKKVDQAKVAKNKKALQALADAAPERTERKEVLNPEVLPKGALANAGRAAAQGQGRLASRRVAGVAIPGRAQPP